MGRLFGHLCSGDTFSHDVYMRDMKAAEEEKIRHERGFAPSWSQQSRSHESMSDASQGKPEMTTNDATDAPPLPSSTVSRKETAPVNPPLPKEPIEEVESTPSALLVNQPLEIPPLSPGKERIKRMEIHRAWKVMMHQQHEFGEAMRIDPLPWPGPDGTYEEGKEEPVQQHMCVDSSENPITTGITTAPSREIADHGSTERQGADDLQVDSSRISSAYLAAREDSYEAWSSMSLLSVGDNHTEMEMMF